MSEQLHNPSEQERKPLPMFDDCANCDTKYQLTPDNTAGKLYPRQRDCNFLLCICPNCANKTRIYCNDYTIQMAMLNGITIHDDEEFADENIYGDWLEMKGIELVPSYEITDRHEKLIGAFATSLATTPDEYLYDLITDTGYDQPYPQRWI